MQFYVGDHQGFREQVVHRYVEKPLNLTGVQIHCNDMIATSNCDHVRHQFRSDRRARFVFLVHPGVGETRDDRRDATSRGSLAGGDEDKELHKHVVHIAAARLDDEDVLITNGF